MKEDIREQVRQKYAQAITSRTGCCGSSGCCGGNQDATNAITGNLYQADELAGMPAQLIQTSLGCGNPTALGALYPGETVLDLGSGAGLDVLLSARRVGSFGKAYGLDMTDEMLAEANANKGKAGLTNVEFLKGHIEDIPLADSSVDVVISNCVINLSADKDQVFREIFRVLKPGGRIAVSDIVATKPLPAAIRQSLLAWAGCVAGALTDEEYKNKLALAGFENIEVVVTRVYDLTSSSAQTMAKNLAPEVTTAELEELNGCLVSAFIRAKKPPCRLVSGHDYTIRPARQADLPAIFDLLATNGLPTVGVADSLERFLVADAQGIIGVIGGEYAGKAALIRSLAVSPRLRKAGVATALVDLLLSEVRSFGAATVYLLTSTAAEYFARRSFVQVARETVPASLLANSGLGEACPSCSSMKLDLE